MTHLPTFNPLYTLFPRQWQSLAIQGKVSKLQDMADRIKNSRLILMCLMADLDLPVSDLYKLSKFADDTQYLCIEDQREQVVHNNTKNLK